MRNFSVSSEVIDNALWIDVINRSQIFLEFFFIAKCVLIS